MQLKNRYYFKCTLVMVRVAIRIRELSHITKSISLKININFSLWCLISPPSKLPLVSLMYFEKELQSQCKNVILRLQFVGKVWQKGLFWDQGPVSFIDVLPYGEMHSLACKKWTFFQGCCLFCFSILNNVVSSFSTTFPNVVQSSSDVLILFN